MTRYTLKRFLVAPFQKFFELSAAGGILLFVAALVALVWANSPWSPTYFKLWEMPLVVGLGHFVLNKPLHFWINEGLMTLFFFLVGLEIKREFMVGELSRPKQAALPIIAALGGMLCPGLIYACFNPPGTPCFQGWGVPTVTDIAFAIGVLALLGNRVPLALKVFLTAIAIADDVGAVVIIALFYSVGIHWFYAFWAAGILTLLMLFNGLGVRSLYAYVLPGVFLWLSVLFSGVHPTLAGVLLAFTLPVGSKKGDSLWKSSPLKKIEPILEVWCNYVILPLFALANAGVALHMEIIPQFLHHPVTWGVVLGLVLGKQLGITLFSWLAVQLGLANLPAGTRWKHLYGVSWLGGIGFTMSLFIANMAFQETTMLNLAKIGVFTASLFAGAMGGVILWRLLPSNEKSEGVLSK